VSETCELCTSCPHRDYCSSLCPEAELYVKQDEAPQNELTIGVPTYGRSRKEIVQELGITRETLKKMIQTIRKKRVKIIPKVEG